MNRLKQAYSNRKKIQGNIVMKKKMFIFIFLHIIFLFYALSMNAMRGEVSRAASQAPRSISRTGASSPWRAHVPSSSARSQAVNLSAAEQPGLSQKQRVLKESKYLNRQSQYTSEIGKTGASAAVIQPKEQVISPETEEIVISEKQKNEISAFFNNTLKKHKEPVFISTAAVKDLVTKNPAALELFAQETNEIKDAEGTVIFQSKKNPLGYLIQIPMTTPMTTGANPRIYSVFQTNEPINIFGLLNEKFPIGKVTFQNLKTSPGVTSSVEKLFGQALENTSLKQREKRENQEREEELFGFLEKFEEKQEAALKQFEEQEREVKLAEQKKAIEEARANEEANKKALAQAEEAERIARQQLEDAAKEAAQKKIDLQKIEETASAQSKQVEMGRVAEQAAEQNIAEKINQVKISQDSTIELSAKEIELAAKIEQLRAQEAELAAKEEAVRVHEKELEDQKRTVAVEQIFAETAEELGEAAQQTLEQFKQDLQASDQQLTQLEQSIQNRSKEIEELEELIEKNKPWQAEIQDARAKEIARIREKNLIEQQELAEMEKQALQKQKQAELQRNSSLQQQKTEIAARVAEQEAEFIAKEQATLEQVQGEIAGKKQAIEQRRLGAEEEFTKEEETIKQEEVELRRQEELQQKEIVQQKEAEMAQRVQELEQEQQKIEIEEKAKVEQAQKQEAQAAQALKVIQQDIANIQTEITQNEHSLQESLAKQQQAKTEQEKMVEQQKARELQEKIDIEQEKQDILQKQQEDAAKLAQEKADFLKEQEQQYNEQLNALEKERIEFEKAEKVRTDLSKNREEKERGIPAQLIPEEQIEEMLSEEKRAVEKAGEGDVDDNQKEKEEIVPQEELKPQVPLTTKTEEKNAPDKVSILVSKPSLQEKAISAEVVEIPQQLFQQEAMLQTPEVMTEQTKKSFAEKTGIKEGASSKWTRTRGHQDQEGRGRGRPGSTIIQTFGGRSKKKEPSEDSTRREGSFSLVSRVGFADIPRASDSGQSYIGGIKEEESTQESYAPTEGPAKKPLSEVKKEKKEAQPEEFIEEIPQVQSTVKKWKPLSKRKKSAPPTIPELAPLPEPTWTQKIWDFVVRSVNTIQNWFK